MLQFDPNTLQEWQQKKITHISIEFVSAWCDGTEIRIHEERWTDGFISFPIAHTDIIWYSDTLYKVILDWAYISQVKWKWILKSDAILTRCWCSKSFSLKSDNPLKDKVKFIKSQLTQKTKHSL